jgi:hypothetical protein
MELRPAEGSVTSVYIVGVGVGAVAGTWAETPERMPTTDMAAASRGRKVALPSIVISSEKMARSMGYVSCRLERQASASIPAIDQV